MILSALLQPCYNCCMELGCTYYIIIVDGGLYAQEFHRLCVYEVTKNVSKHASLVVPATMHS